MKPKLTLEKLRKEATLFSQKESKHWEPKLYGVTDEKAVGTYFEHKFQLYLREKYTYSEGNSARGMDFPGLLVDMKVTSIKQPQSSCPFKSARQKVFGLGYSLLVFVYEKSDNESKRSGNLNIIHKIFIKKNKTADFQTTVGLKQILENEGNLEDILAFLTDRNLPLDDIEANQIANELLKGGLSLGYLTISNALQWRLQYSRVIEKAGKINGIIRLR